MRGSATRRVGKGFFAGKNPLHGRWTTALDTEPVRDAACRFPSCTSDEMIAAHAVFGGVACHLCLELRDLGADLEDGVISPLPTASGPLIDEPAFFRRSGVRTVRRSASGAAALAAGGCTKLGEVTGRVASERSKTRAAWP